jgi:G3E family GTPase
VTAIPNDLPVVLVGGFLGSGKTTLLNNLLRNTDGIRVAVLVNDFGEISIDASLIESVEENILHIAGGCMCCSYGNDLVAALRKISRKRDLFDRVLIETSGVSLPYAIACTVPLIAGLELKATVVVVDSYSLWSQLDDPLISDTVLRQIASANLVVLNKVDRISVSAQEGALSQLRKICPETKVYATTRSEISWQDICELSSQPNLRQLSSMSSISPGSLFVKPGFGKTTEGHNPEAYFDSCTLEMPGRYDFAALGKALTRCGSYLLRAKVIALNKEGDLTALSYSSDNYETLDLATRPVTAYGVFIFRSSVGSDRFLKNVISSSLSQPKPSVLG